MLALFRKVKQILRLYKAFLNGNFGLFGTKLLFEMRDKILVYPACLSLALRYSRLTSFIDGVTCVLFCGFSMGAVPFLRTSAVPCMWLNRPISVSILVRVPMGLCVDAFSRGDVSLKSNGAKRPLQGTKLLVTVAMSRSRGDSMMRQPTTPHALHPKPIAMVRDCLPCAPAFLKYRSMLKAMRGR